MNFVSATLTAEVTIKYDTLHRIINLDETHHKKSSEGDHGGTRSVTLTNPNLSRTGSRYAKDSGNHVTGCYGTTPLEPMPPVIIYSTSSRNEKNMKVRPQWTDGLPIVKGEWGLGEMTAMDTQVSVRIGGGMDEDLFISTVLFYKTLYKDTIAPKFEWDGDRIVKGPIAIKSDSGPGRQCKSQRSIKFRRDMHLEGVHIFPGLPNTTSCTQEMDDIFQQFKGDCDTQAQEVFARKTYEKAAAVEYKAKEKELARERGEAIAPEVEGIRVSVAHLTNDDLPEILNGKPGEPIDKRPFDKNFTPGKIFRCWMNIGWTPFTRNALKHKKVRHMLGDGGANSEMKETLESVVEQYAKLKGEIKEYGINDFVFRSSIQVHKKHPSTAKTEEEQIKTLVEGKGAFSAGGQWCAMGFQLLGSRALVRAQLIQVQKEKEKTTKAAAKKEGDRQGKIDAAKKSVDLYKGEPAKMKSPDWQNIMKFLLPIFDKSTAPSKVNSKVKVTAKLEEIEKKNGKGWVLLLEEELVRAQAAMATEVVGNQGGGVDWSEFHLDKGSDNEGEDEEVEVVAEQAAV